MPLCKVLSSFQYPVLTLEGGCSLVRSYQVWGLIANSTSQAMHMPVACDNRHATLRNMDRGEGFQAIHVFEVNLCYQGDYQAESVAVVPGEGVNKA